MNCNELHAFVSSKFPVAADILRNHFMDGALLSDSTTHELILIGIPLGIAKTILGVVRGELDITLLPSEQSLREALQDAISGDVHQQNASSQQGVEIHSPSGKAHLSQVHVTQELVVGPPGRSPPPLPTPSPSTPTQPYSANQHHDLVWSDLSLAAQTALRAALKHAQIYSQKSCESNPYYASINEAAKQLILEGKVTIADSKGHILELAKRAVNKTYAFKKGKSRSRCTPSGAGGMNTHDILSEVAYVEKENASKLSAFCLNEVSAQEGVSQTSKRCPHSSKRRRTSEETESLRHSSQGN
jgi:hypothetical protein